MSRKPAFMMLAALALVTSGIGQGSDPHKGLKPSFHTSDRCMPCHNGLSTSSGQDVSIGLHWRASIMANSARDPYWQASVRRESIDHPESKRAIEDECSICHMPIARYQAKIEGREAEVFAHLPFSAHPDDAEAQDGVSCSVCHQISSQKLGTRESFSGQFLVESPVNKTGRPEYGPYEVTTGRQKIMNSSTGGFLPTQAQHIRDSALCGSCHQLYTTARGPGGKAIGSLPEQMPYLEWLHSDYPGKYSCQACHMPAVQGEIPVSAVLGVPRAGARVHAFIGGNFFMQNLLNRFRNDLSVAALPEEMTAAASGTVAFLQSQSARLTIRSIDARSGTLDADVYVENLTGHKLPTAYPSRRVWIHFLVRDRSGRVLFESGAINPDGSISGNDNDTDPTRYEPHYREITRSDQVQIYEPILKDSAGHVTTGLLSAVGYLKDNRLLPSGFNKQSAEQDIAVVGDASNDPGFTGSGDLVRYSVPIGDAQGPIRVSAELWYQPIGFRWAHNLAAYRASEPQRFVQYYESMSPSTAIILARTQTTQ